MKTAWRFFWRVLLPLGAVGLLLMEIALSGFVLSGLPDPLFRIFGMGVLILTGCFGLPFFMVWASSVVARFFGRPFDWGDLVGK